VQLICLCNVFRIGEFLNRFHLLSGIQFYFFHLCEHSNILQDFLQVVQVCQYIDTRFCRYRVNYSPPSRCTRLEEGASIRRSLVSRLRGVKFTGRFLTVQTLQTILCSELTPASQPVLCKVILYSQYILSECCV